MMIYVEGADGSGKSTLCEKLKKDGFTVISIPIKKGWVDEYKKFKHTEQPIVIDRSPITDVVYRIQDEKTTELKLTDLLHLTKNQKIIYCNSDTCFEDSMERGEDNITTEIMSNQICKTYTEVIKLLKILNNLKVFEYNWHEDFDGSLYKKVVKFIKEK